MCRVAASILAFIGLTAAVTFASPPGVGVGDNPDTARASAIRSPTSSDVARPNGTRNVRASRKAKRKAAGRHRRRPCRATKRGPVYRSPGYRGVCKRPKTKPAPPLPPITLSPEGRFPEMVVDPAGTAHVVWSEDGVDQPDRLRYCRIKRGASVCDNPPDTRSLIPNQPYDSGAEPGFNEDTAGPAVAVVGNDLALLSYRYPILVPKPDGDLSPSSTYIWLSDNGGQSVVGPGLVGDLAPSGGITVYGSAESPRIGVITDTTTGGTFFQSIIPGAYNGSQANLGADGPDRAYSGSLTTVGGLPVAAFSDLTEHTFIRAWNGAGSPEDPANWSEAVIPGVEPKLTSGPVGTFVVNRPEFSGPLRVRRLDGTTAGPPVKVSNTETVGAGRDIYADPGGALRVAWSSGGPGKARLLERSSSDGRRFGPARTLARAGDFGEVKLGTAADGGGFAAYTADPGSQAYGKIRISPFGNQQANGETGLGGQPGAGAAPDTHVSCQEISYGAVEILSREGCLLSAAGKGAVKVSEGTVRVNGLEIVPDAGVRLLFGTRARTIDSTGRVTVQLQAPGGPIVLFKGEIHIELPAIGSGTTLAIFDSAKYKASIKGFPVKGDVKVILRDKSVEIPVSLKLPKVFGGLTGQATLEASNAHGLEVSSLRFRVGNLALGPVGLRDLDIDWASGGNWKGGGKVDLVGASLEARLEFKNGSFSHGSVTVTPVPFPGVAVFADVFLNRVGGELWLDPFAIEAKAYFGAQPLRPPDIYVFGIESSLKVSTKPDFAIDVNGAGSLAELPLYQSHMHGDAAGRFSLDAAARIELAGVVDAGYTLNGFVDADRGEFGAGAGFHGCLGSDPFKICSGFSGILSGRGFAACYGGFVGFGYSWKEGLEGLGPPSCDVEDFFVDEEEVRAGPGGNGAELSAVPGERSFMLPVGLPSATIRLTGTGDLPGATVVSPSGDRYVPVPVNAGNARTAPVTVAIMAGRTHIGLLNPVGGRWRIEPPAGSTISELAIARGLTKPKVTGKVKRDGKGGPRARVIDYRATSRPGLKVRFFEGVGDGARLIGATRRKRGRIRFTAGDGPVGRRPIYALAEQDGLPRLRKVIARYKAPGPIRPGRPRTLKIRRKGRTVKVHWRKVPGAADYEVRIAFRSGRVLLKLPVKPRLRIRGVSRRDRIRVTVAARSPLGRTGPRAVRR